MRPTVLIASVSILLSLPVGGCYDNVETFAKRAAKHNCKRVRECQKSQFEDQYNGDLGRCRDEQYTDFLDLHDNLLGELCDYVPDEARECATTIRSYKKDCSDEADDDIADACDRVYDCPGLLEIDGEEVTPGQLVSEPSQAARASTDPDDDPDADPPPPPPG